MAWRLKALRHRLKDIKHDIRKLLEENIFWHKSYQCFLRSVSQGNGNKSKNKQMGPNQTSKLLYSKWSSLSCVRLFVTPWTVAYHAPLSVGFSRQEYWSGLPFPSPGDLPNPGIEPGSPALQADALSSEPPGKLLYSQGNHKQNEKTTYGLGENICKWSHQHGPSFQNILISHTNQ